MIAVHGGLVAHLGGWRGDRLSLSRDAGPVITSYSIHYTKLYDFSLKPAVATILNLSEDHLDRYDGMAGYLAAKQRVFLGAQKRLVNRDDAATLPPDGDVWCSFGLDAAAYGRVMLGGELQLAVAGEPRITSYNVCYTKLLR